MKELCSSARIELGKISFEWYPITLDTSRLTVNSAEDLPIMNGSQMPRPIVVSRMKVIRMA